MLSCAWCSSAHLSFTLVYTVQYVPELLSLNQSASFPIIYYLWLWPALSELLDDNTSLWNKVYKTVSGLVTLCHTLNTHISH